MSPVRPSLLLAAFAVGSLTGCDGTSDDTGLTDDTGSDTDDTDDTDVVVEPVYGVISVPSTTDSTTTSYVILGGSLTDEFDPADAVLELTGRAIAGSPEGSSQVFIGSSTGSTLTRYDYADGTLVENGTIDFAVQQVTSFAGYSSQLAFVDADTAYWFDRTGRIVVWNPTDFRVDGAIVVADMLREDANNAGTNYTTSITGAPVWDGDTLYSFFSWDSRNAGTITVPGAYGIIAVNTTNDTAQVYIDEGGCGYGRDGVIDGDHLYIATEAVGTSVHYLNDANGPKPCLRRFNTSTKQFDSTFTVDLNALAGGPAGSLVTTSDGTALIHILDTDQADPLIADNTLSNPRALSSAELWETAVLHVGDTPTITPLAVPLRSASVLPVTLLDDLRVTPTFGAAPDILEVTDAGIKATAKTGATVTDFTSAVFQIQ